MTQGQIDKLISEREFPEATDHCELVETHISWVILCDDFVYKVKKPIKYSFLDFSTVERRKHFCERELQLNQRFAKDIYLGVLPVYQVNGHFKIGGDFGAPIDYTLKMRKLDPKMRMDKLLKQGRVSEEHIKNLAEWIENFHKKAAVIREKDVLDIKEKFNDLVAEKQFISEQLGFDSAKTIDRAVIVSDGFFDKHEKLLKDRLRSGFFRDCHGDLHSRNIFLLPGPQPFDCLEFNDDYRQIDVLNEVAFLCMDLDAHDKNELSELCIGHYNLHFPAMRNDEERQLFTYYKCYRANVRAKVNSLRAKSAYNNADQKKTLLEVQKYLDLMEDYLKSFSQ
ncbi:hypothetical protein [Flagellimonas lutaonensis]|uniref:Aminoglycoside phosphotransferase domain-containing protein n=1 Tax=Flagellimonas lutaonensis TaxID=516051 RepID=A0A0D5YQS8_9FLAO|nr:hypothetical protein [Allomuricauda lutaonensis]AKA34279.1 hypothetical protein VC82_607 [Allomuricauda lutaonensis]